MSSSSTSITEKLSKHGVTTVDQFAVLSCEEVALAIVGHQRLQCPIQSTSQLTLLNSMWQRNAIKLDLLVSNISWFARNLTH